MLAANTVNAVMQFSVYLLNTNISNSNSTSNSNSNSNKTMDNPHSYDGRINYIHGHNVTYTKSMSRQQGVEAYLGQTPGFAYAHVVQLGLVWG